MIAQSQTFMTDIDNITFFRQVQHIAEKIVRDIMSGFNLQGLTWDVRDHNVICSDEYMSQGVAVTFLRATVQLITPWGMWEIIKFASTSDCRLVRVIYGERMCTSKGMNALRLRPIRSDIIDEDATYGLRSLGNEQLPMPVYLDQESLVTSINHWKHRNAWQHLSRIVQSVKIAKVILPKKVTFTPLKRGRFRCNQTKVVLSRSAVDGYRRSQESRQ